jgi:hypothetical protein
MPRKQFEEQPYNPIEADLARDAAASGRPVADGQDRMHTHLAETSLGGAIIEHQRSKHHQAKLNLPTTLAPKSEVAKRFSLTRDEDLDIAEFLRRLQRQSGTKVALSLLIRASLTLMMHAEAEILTQMRKSPPPSQPATHDSLAYAEFEHYWVQLLVEALRNTRPMR